MIWRIVLAVATLVVVVMVLGGIYASNIVTMIRAGEAMSGPMAETVQIRPVERDQWEEVVRAIGTVAAVEGAVLRAESDGRIEAILFASGETVKKGQPLLRIDSAVEQAQLEVAKATRQLAEATVTRIRELHRKSAVSDADLDAAEAQWQQSHATVRNLEAILAQRTLVAPFSGQLGISRLSVGDFINRGQEVVSLQNLDRLRVDFNLPQNQLGKVSAGMRVRLRSNAWPEAVFEGELAAIDAQIHERTRNFSGQALFDNPDGKLKPGMFVQVELVQARPRDVIMVPQTAIRFATFGNSVFVVSESEHADMEKAHQVRVELGESRGDFIEVRTGLTGDERVVTAGTFKLRDGSLVRHSDKGTIEPSLAPTPPNR